jgi:hypothetical protein
VYTVHTGFIDVIFFNLGDNQLLFWSQGQYWTVCIVARCRRRRHISAAAKQQAGLDCCSHQEMALVVCHVGWQAAPMAVAAAAVAVVPTVVVVVVVAAAAAAVAVVPTVVVAAAAVAVVPTAAAEVAMVPIAAAAPVH